jgi:ADP-ribose pyrophosphatase YjhB (NUDIX family)
VSSILPIVQGAPKPFVGDKAAIARVRCVLMHDDRFLLAQHNTQRRENVGKWALPGGRLKGAEKPKACLRRELVEELGCQVPYLIKLGDWLHQDEQQRVFGCELDEPIHAFDAAEIRAIGWFSYLEVAEFAAARKLRTGFELAAIAEFRRQHAASRR